MSEAPKIAAANAASREPAASKVTALGRSRKRPLRPLKLRLIDAVTLAAAGLLVLKLSTLLVEPPRSEAELPDFARVLAKARTGYEIPDPTTTGSVTPKEPEKPAEMRKPEPAAAVQAAVQAPVQAMPESVSPTERALLEKLGARREALKQRSQDLDLREQMLGEAERKLEGGVSDLKQAEDKADAGGSKKAEAEKAGLRNIVTMYETMKPKDAARVFDRLHHDVLVPIVLAMNPRKMAEVLAVMQPDTAEKLTVALANRARGVTGPQAQASAGPGLPPNELPAIDPAAPPR
jgi:flagellar motility protein MotE (MotC chaperone)